MTEQKLVPVRITPEMLKAGQDVFWSFDIEEVGSAVVLEAVYRAMLSAAPSPDTGKMGGEGVKRLDKLQSELTMFAANMRRDAADERSDGLIPYAESVSQFARELSGIIMSMSPDEAPVSGGEGEAVAWRRFADRKSQAAYDVFRRDGWMRGDVERFYRQGFIGVSQPEAGTPRGAVWWAGRDRAAAGLPSGIPAEFLSSEAHPSDSSATERMRADLRRAAEYLCRLEGALLRDDLDMAMHFPGEPSPTALAEEICPGFDSIEYDMQRESRAALGEA